MPPSDARSTYSGVILTEYGKGMRKPGEERDSRSLLTVAEPESETLVATVDDFDESTDLYSPGQMVALRLWIALARCYGTVHKAVAHKVEEYDLTTAQFGVLEVLHHLGPVTLGDLAEKLLVTGGNVTYVMDRLQRDGLVTRRRCSEDRRVVWAQLTDEGKSLIEEVFPGHAAYIEELVGGLDADERTELRRLLKKLGKGIARPETQE